MSDEISQIVEVYISRETAQVNTASFDVPLLFVNLPDVPDPTDPVNTIPADVTDRVQVFTQASQVADAFGTDSTAHKMAVKLMGGDVRPAQFMVGVKNSAETYKQGVTEAIAYNGDWYMIAADTKQSQDIKDIAEVIQATRRMYIASSSEEDITDMGVTNDLGSFLKDTNYDRTILVYHTKAEEQFPEVAWMGTQLTFTPGSNTWAFKGGAGVTRDRLSGTQLQALRDKNVNFYTAVGGVNMFQTGCTSQGEWID